MALTQALPNPGQWLEQFRARDGDTWIQTLSARLLTAGSIAMTGIAVFSVAIFLGIGTTFAEQILTYTVVVPFIGAANVLVSIALAGGVVAVPYAFQIEEITGDREILANDAKWIIGASALLYLLAAFQVGYSLAPTVRLTCVIVGMSYATLYIWKIGEDYRS